MQRSETASAKQLAVDWPQCKAQILHGDCLDALTDMPAESVDLIVTSPPYADARQRTYGGVKPEDYVDWFSPRAAQMQRVLKPTGSFVLNIKEKASDGERHTYVLDLILHLKREIGFRWVEEYIWHKTTAAPGKWKYRFRDAWERVLHFAKGRDVKMNQDAVMVPTGDWTKARLKNMSVNDLSRQESATRSGVGRRISAWEGPPDGVSQQCAARFAGSPQHGAQRTLSRVAARVFRSPLHRPGRLGGGSVLRQRHNRPRGRATRPAGNRHRNTG